MNALSLIVNGIASISLLLIAVVLLGMLAVYADRRRQLFLAGLVNGSRMARMMRHLGINPTVYLYEEDSRAIARHVRNCQACPDTAGCEKVLCGAQEDYAFCTNRDMLAQRLRLAAMH